MWIWKCCTAFAKYFNTSKMFDFCYPFHVGLYEDGIVCAMMLTSSCLNGRGWNIFFVIIGLRVWAKHACWLRIAEQLSCQYNVTNCPSNLWCSHALVSIISPVWQSFNISSLIVYRRTPKLHPGHAWIIHIKKGIIQIKEVSNVRIYVRTHVIRTLV